MARPGDTLYMIAWEVGLDYRQLADWNGLMAPYRIASGMRIRLSPPRGWEVDGEATKGARVSPLSNDQTISVGSAIQTVSGVSGSLNKSNSVDPEYEIADWLWPATGPIIEHFNGNKGNNGLDISGSNGTPIRAAADGIVVYAGSGLRGYGQLLIIQHNDMFLSAYAHNQELFVREGKTVRRGQTVAKMGDTDAESPRLHFEIRRDGKPVNPLDYLPD
jgi:lipoprotein NlpD